MSRNELSLFEAVGAGLAGVAVIGLVVIGGASLGFWLDSLYPRLWYCLGTITIVAMCAVSWGCLGILGLGLFGEWLLAEIRK